MALVQAASSIGIGTGMQACAFILVRPSVNHLLHFAWQNRRGLEMLPKTDQHADQLVDLVGIHGDRIAGGKDRGRTAPPRFCLR